MKSHDQTRATPDLTFRAKRHATQPAPRVSALAGTWMAVLIAATGACSSGSDGTPGNGLGGSTSSGGASSTTGGASTGGTAGLGTGGVVPTGGAIGTGGTTGTGGVSSGGVSSGGVSSGGVSSGGVSSGGVSSGGASGGGGTTSGLGGTAGGGSAGRSGGAGGNGGSATGGSSSGGSGGKSSGGSSSGGSGAGSGGTAGSGGATSGYNPCPTTAGTACAVLPLGDSITEGCCTAPMGGYRIELFRQAVTNKKNLTFVGSLSNGPDMVESRAFPKKHEGHGGWKISQIDGVVPSPALNTIPHIVLLMIGTNDINGNDDINNAPNRLGTLIDGITTSAPAALVVVAAIIPTTTDGTNQRVQAYNTAMRTQVTMRAASGKHVVFLDNYAAFSQNANYKTALMADNLHPNTAGYVVLGQSFYGVIGSLLPAAP